MLMVLMLVIMFVSSARWGNQCMSKLWGKEGRLVKVGRERRGEGWFKGVGWWVGGGKR